MRKLSKILVLVLALAMLTAVFAISASATNSSDKWYVAGVSGLCGSNWSNNDPNNLMTYQDGTHVKVYERVPAGTYEFKCVKNANWNTSYGFNGGTANASVTVDVAGSTVTITVSGTNTVTVVVTPPAACDHEYAVTNPCVAVACVKCGIPTSGAAAHTYGDDTVCDKCGFDHTQTHKVYFKNTANWSVVTVHNWSDAGGGTTWPGTKMEKEGDLYVIELPAGRDKLIFNNNNGGTQTADLPIPSEPMVFNWDTKAWEAAPHVCEFVAGEVVAPTYTTGGYTVYSCVCGLTENRDETAKLVPAFPEATVTPAENSELTFALNFGIKGVSIVDGEIVLDETILTEEYILAVLETYGRMYVDYRLTISGLSDPSVTFNSDGNADGYLGGQYDAWSENWVYVPFENVVIENGKSLMIMELAAEMMGQPGLRQILEEIITVVIDFNCGVYFTPEFLEHNPDMVVTLELLVFNEDAEGNMIDVIEVAKNVFTVPHVHAHEAVVTAPTCTEAGYTTYTCDCGDTYVADEVAALGHDYKNGGKCADCEAVPANDYLINFSEWRPFAKETFADGDTVKYNDIFTFIYGKNSRVDASSKTWDDLSATLRFSLGGKTNSGVPTKNAIQITVDGAYTLKIWYVAGGDARNFVLVDAEGNALSETTTETVKNGQYYAELEIAAAGTYYLTIPADNNYIFQLELAEVPHEHTWVDATCTTPKTCSGCGETEGEALGHTYFYNLCLVCYAANPYFENNFTTVGENKLVCNEWHLVESDGGHGKPYQFTFVTIPEDGLYIFTADATKLGVFIYTTPYDASDVDGWATGGANWNAVTFGQAELKAGTYYLGFIFYNGEGEYDLTITKHTEHSFEEGACTVCGEPDPNWVPPHEHNFVEGKCECGETDPNYVEPVEPQEELNFFQKILAWFMELIRKLLAIFKR